MYRISRKLACFYGGPVKLILNKFQFYTILQIQINVKEKKENAVQYKN